MAVYTAMLWGDFRRGSLSTFLVVKWGCHNKKSRGRGSLSTFLVVKGGYHDLKCSAKGLARQPPILWRCFRRGSLSTFLVVKGGYHNKKSRGRGSLSTFFVVKGGYHDLKCSAKGLARQPPIYGAVLGGGLWALFLL